uniref:Cytochrome c oxidase subunit 2 n=1 Tax=Fulvia mutica TaxID=80828 RepID=T2HFZ8_FULMU|nr:cytochrome c oxidase subunit II [Fulvia mutica]BAN79048.1 cytochrome c oxidase subunit 2 [Fulvia mutica]
MVWDKQMHFNDPVTINMKYMMLYHGGVMAICIIVMAVVCSGFGYMLLSSAEVSSFCNEYTNNDMVETLWTGIPMILLFMLCVPSLNLLYLSGFRPGGYELNLKVIGHQWYWSYEYNLGAKEGGFDSYMTPWEEGADALILYMDVDNRCVLPINTLIRVLYSSVDVIHSWFIPSFGFKNDCVPGRVGSSSLVVKEPGVYYGFCTELCGAMHSEMPIVVEALPKGAFYNWLDTILD